MKAFILGALICIFGFSALANWDLEQRRINFLIDSVDHLVDADFIRNGTAYDSHTAASHLRDKLQAALGFAGRNDNYTAEDFIEKIASKSYFTGKPYYIQFHDGRTVPARDWLYHQLSSFQF